jgi:hypothetical protein
MAESRTSKLAFSKFRTFQCVSHSEKISRPRPHLVHLISGTRSKPYTGFSTAGHVVTVPLYTCVSESVRVLVTERT